MSTIDRLTVLFTKIDGVAQLSQDLGEAHVRERVVELHARQREIVVGNDGEVIEFIGNDLLSVFPSPDTCLNAAVQMQNQFYADSMLFRDGCGQRIGLHHGVVYRKGGDIFGDTVNTASRVVNLAKPEQVLITEQAVQETHAQTQELLRPFDRVHVKGKREELVIFECMWRPDDLDQTKVVSEMIDTGYLKNLSAVKLRLEYEGKSIDLNPGMLPVTVGRGRHCEIMVTSPAASRNHCRIDHRRGKFILIDESTNGTHLLRVDGSDAILRREEAVLTGSGCFCMGEQARADHPYRVNYTCS